jgi:hypothetical protein
VESIFQIFAIPNENFVGRCAFCDGAVPMTDYLYDGTCPRVNISFVLSFFLFFLL